MTMGGEPDSEDLTDSNSGPQATADRPELAQDIRIIAKRVAASFTGLILLSDLLAGLPHDNDDVPD